MWRVTSNFGRSPAAHSIEVPTPYVAWTLEDMIIWTARVFAYLSDPECYFFPTVQQSPISCMSKPQHRFHPNSSWTRAVEREGLETSVRCSYR